MCRIVGFMPQPNMNKDNNILIVNMADTLAHGGPDAAGYYTDEYIALGHRRLSIIDLSDAATQPMCRGRYVVVFNGEIYNYQDVKDELTTLGAVFTTKSDTEVLLLGWSIWGAKVLDKCRGMFAFAIWDKQAQQLTLCRDRLGVKPLYYYHKDGLFMFASELKAFHQHPDFDKTIDQASVMAFLRQEYIESPNSIFKWVKKVPPGHILTRSMSAKIQLTAYWEARNYLKVNRSISEQEAIEEAEYLLKESCRLRMIADVPVGIFLSGGTDSSLVTALLQSESSTPLHTFTVAFEDKKYNEGEHAQLIASHLGTHHETLVCTAQDFRETIDLLPDMYDEPFGGESAIPTYLVARLAKNKVKVALSADGGDELFGGYVKYTFTKKYYPTLSQWPFALRNAISYLLQTGNSEVLNQLNRLPVFNRYSNIAQKLPKLQRALRAQTLEDFFYEASTYADVSEMKYYIDQHSPSNPLYPHAFETDGMLSYLGLLDIEHYLEGEVLAKVDRATMHTALEGREPLLDHKLVEFALSLPDHIKMSNGVSKSVLKNILKKYVPGEITERPKQGFSVPIGDWLNTALLPEVQEMLNDRAFMECFNIRTAHLATAVQRFQQGRAVINAKLIWNFVTLHKWYKRWIA